MPAIYTFQFDNGEGLFGALVRPPPADHRRGQAGRVGDEGVLPAAGGVAAEGELPHEGVRGLAVRRRLLQEEHRDRRAPGVRRLLQRRRWAGPFGAVLGALGDAGSYEDELAITGQVQGEFFRVHVSFT